MSIWTHVAGVIRIDSCRFKTLDFDELIGKECLFESDMSIWDDAENHPEEYLPMGGEGSLQKSIWINPDVNCLAAYTVTIFGDLRGYDSPQKIIDWFKDKCKDLSPMVRNAVIVAECESGKTLTYTYSAGGD